MYYPMPAPPVLTPFHPDSLGLVFFGSMASGAFRTIGEATSVPWGTANIAVFIPFHLSVYATALQLFWWVGANVNGSVDVGIYYPTGKRIVSAGGVAIGTANTLQFFNITDTELEPGDYLIGASANNSLSSAFACQPADELGLPSFAVYDMATAYPLPDPATLGISTLATPQVPVVGIQFAATM